MAWRVVLDTPASHGEPGRRRFLPLPLVTGPVGAERGNWLEGGIEGTLDLARDLIKNPGATFLVRVAGDSMSGAGILSGSFLIVDRTLVPGNGDIIIARLGDEFCVKRFSRDGDRVLLEAENDAYQSLEVTEEMDFEVWGKVTCSLHFH